MTDLRDYLATRDLRRVKERVDVETEAAAVLSMLETGGPVLLENTGTAHIVSSLVTSRSEIANVLNCATGHISGTIQSAILSPTPPSQVASGEVNQIVTDKFDLREMAFPRFFENETGAYITGGIICVTDVISGKRNLSYARFKILDGHTAMLGVSPNHHLGQMAKRAKAAGKNLPIAVVLGVHPAITLAACLYLGFGDDELEVAGTLLGEPVAVIPVSGGDVWVPSNAEMVLEGEVSPDELIEEGLVSEFHGRYHDYGKGIVTRFTRLRHRKNPIVHVVVPGLHREHLILASVPIAAGLLTSLRKIEPSIIDIAVPDSGAGRMSAVISVKNLPPGRAKQLMFACWSQVPLVRQVVIVDAEIDPWNAEAVEWARIMHARPERDMFIVEGVRSDRSDVLAQNFQVGKLGIDATAKHSERGEGWGFAQVSPQARDRAAEILAQAGFEPTPSTLNAGLNF